MRAMTVGILLPSDQAIMKARLDRDGGALASLSRVVAALKEHPRPATGHCRH